MKSLAFILIALALSACASTGRQVSQAQLSDFKKGETTIDEVVAKLGTPTTTTLSSDGTRSLSYVFSQTQVHAATFIPIVGAFAGGADSQVNVTTLVFNSDGKLKEFSATESQQTFNMGGVASATPRIEQAEVPK